MGAQLTLKTTLQVKNSVDNEKSVINGVANATHFQALSLESAYQKFYYRAGLADMGIVEWQAMAASFHFAVRICNIQCFHYLPVKTVNAALLEYFEKWSE